MQCAGFLKRDKNSVQNSFFRVTIHCPGAAGLAVIAVWQFRRPECTYSKKACMALLSAACVVILAVGLVQGVPALLAGLATGVWDSLGEVKGRMKTDRLYEPAMDEATRTKLLRGWHKAVGRSLDWAEPEE